MSEPICLRPEDVESARAEARAAIVSSELPRAAADSAPGPYGPSRGALALLEALESALAHGLAAEAGCSRASRPSGLAASPPESRPPPTAASPRPCAPSSPARRRWRPPPSALGVGRDRHNVLADAWIDGA